MILFLQDIGIKMNIKDILKYTNSRLTCDNNRWLITDGLFSDQFVVYERKHRKLAIVIYRGDDEDLACKYLANNFDFDPDAEE
jgi:hypothetical protein